LLGSAPVSVAIRRVSVVGTSGAGNVKDLIWARADTVVWLDLPKRTVMRRIIWRSFQRAARRVELWNGNRERWRNLFSVDKEESVVAWAWQTHAATRAKLEAAMADPANAKLHFVRLRSPAEVQRFLSSVSGSGSGGD
jgi:ribose 1,5-bisphosphokinase PhnN